MKEIIEATLGIIGIAGAVLFFIMLGVLGIMTPFSTKETIDFVGGIICIIGGVSLIGFILCAVFHLAFNND